MGKINNTVNNNSHNNHGQNSVESPFFSTSIKENYLKLINISKSVSFFNNTTIELLITNTMNTNERLSEEYSNKYIQSIYENNELYNLFLTTLRTNDELLENNIKNIENQLEIERNEINNNLLKQQQEAISKYREQENIFLPKSKALVTNKTVHKEQLYHVVREINQRRIEANHKYIALANEISSINEQQQLKFKHNLESAIEKNIYDKSVINEDIKIRINTIEDELNHYESVKFQLIHTKEKEIIDNTIKLNTEITKIGLEYENRLKYGYVPYDIKLNKLVDELSENERAYNTLEEQVLSEFKTLLQDNDIEIENIKEAHKKFVNEYLAELKSLKKQFNSNLQKEINLIDKKISVTTASSDLTKREVKKIIQKLVKEKKEFVRKQIKIKAIKINELKSKYLEYELEYIEKYEQLRSKKSECEAIKSSAMKNINYERVFHHERINSEIKMINMEKESFATLDHYEELKEIYHNRYLTEIENEKIKYEINEIGIDIDLEKINGKYKIDQLIEEKIYNSNLCDADLFYQEESIKNRIDFFNVKAMLDIEKEKIINKYEKEFATEKIEFERIKQNFYNSCSNIQYQIYINNNDLVYKLIDEDVKLNQDLSEMLFHHKEAISKQEITYLNNENLFQENLLHINLYKNRLDIEKAMIIDLFDAFYGIYKTICYLENFIHNVISHINKTEFSSNKKEILILLETIRQIKMAVLKAYFSREIQIINTRFNFEKNIKFNKQIESTKNEFISLLKNLNEKIQKTEQKLNSYHNTIVISAEAIKKNKNVLNELYKKTIFTKMTTDEKNSIKKQIQNIKENIILLKKQIKANSTNVRKIILLKHKQKEEIRKKEKMYNSRLDKINRSLKNEKKIYSYLTDILHHQRESLNNQVYKCGHLTSISRYSFESINKVQTKIAGINNKILAASAKYFDIQMQKIENTFKKQYNLQQEVYTKNYNRYSKEFKRSRSIEVKEYQTNITTITNAHNSIIDTLKRQSSYQENKLLLELRKINDEYASNIKKYNQRVNKIEQAKTYELRCHEENYQMFIKQYNSNNTKIINLYLIKINEIKKAYNNKLNELKNKYNLAVKKIKTQRVNNINLRKSNETTTHGEYQENIKNTNIKITSNNQIEKRLRIRFEENERIRSKLYLQNQQNTKSEFYVQTKQIKNKCNQRIRTLQKEFIRELKYKKRLMK